MNCDFLHKNTRSRRIKRLSRFALTSSVGLFSIAFNLIWAPDAQASAPEQLTVLEKSIDGSSRSGGAIEKRIKDLELKVFAKVQKGSLNSRINALEKFAGINKSDYMPPLPPLFDNGQSPVKRAPTLEASKIEEAIKLHQDGKVFEAERSLKQILQSSPTNADACFSLGAIAETRGDLNTALDFYTSAVQANPTDEEAKNAVAEISRKITAARSGPFINPLAPASQQVLQGHALELTAAQRNPLNGQAAFSSPPIPTLTVGNQPIPTATTGPSTKSIIAKSVARSLARAAIGAALGQAGLHCPACALLRGFP